ncbi:glycoside hydrolase family 2 TIM barrel-domain containing protein [Fimbriimonas ginsengisoli]|uniref:Glycoside hydrolase family 2 catalytic domain-containing protein n=1 Tax=Fimbriimonas ginsengisoli Gsoil 348 TaxID=661478 RepID=A0A068NQL7_FIMGI|nr:glycoside hydrolase family 2 TIM barrel-domain containing protein [Fimbriimonas ginsengisoli]AIE85657.1 hypothetical protein OP10G_2289 [Fimbriimonas ginsengisoli Gsoil 348]
MLAMAVLAPILVLPVQVPAVVRLRHDAAGYSLTVDGKPFFIKGVGGDGPKAPLVKLGANAFRTWDADKIDDQLDEAKRLGLKVVVGIWLGHKEHGFKYDDPKMVADQLTKAKLAVSRYRNHPAVLMWALGNEMEGYADGGDPNMWGAVEQMAREVKQIDPNHPTMTVVAEVGGKRVESIHKLCPDIDVVGINSYGGAPSIAERYRKAGGTKPYVITEFGTLGPWEVGKTAWGAPIEPTSTAKADFFRRGYEGGVLGAKDLCLGSFAFTWGHKQEATSTWFGMLLPTGERLGAVDTMSELWSGKPLPNRAPLIDNLGIEGVAEVAVGATIRATVKASDPEGDELKYRWVLQREASDRGVGGAAESVPPVYPDAVTASGPTASVVVPAAGHYRIFVYIYDNHGGAAVANVPISVKQ